MDRTELDLYTRVEPILDTILPANPHTQGYTLVEGGKVVLFTGLPEKRGEKGPRFIAVYRPEQQATAEKTCRNLRFLGQWAMQLAPVDYDGMLEFARTAGIVVCLEFDMELVKVDMREHPDASPEEAVATEMAKLVDRDRQQQRQRRRRQN